jgi:hypothetical protein
MKKIVLLSVLSLLIISSCKKKEDNPSIVVTASFPTIVFSSQYYSVAVGSVRPVVQAVAYDSFYKETCKIITIDSAVNTFVPGFYTGTIWAQNKYGYVTYANYYVAVTNIANTMDLAGHWRQSSTDDSISTDIHKLANGLYRSTNVDGVNTWTNPTAVVEDYFVVTSPTSITFASGNTGTLSYIAIPGISTMTYDNSLGTTLTFTR